MQEASDKSLRTMFRDVSVIEPVSRRTADSLEQCGSIREVKVNQIADRVYATVEFTTKVAASHACP